MPGPEGHRPNAARAAEFIIGNKELNVNSLGGQERDRTSAPRAKEVKRSGCGGGVGYTC